MASDYPAGCSRFTNLPLLFVCDGQPVTCVRVAGSLVWSFIGVKVRVNTGALWLGYTKGEKKVHTITFCVVPLGYVPYPNAIF